MALNRIILWLGNSFAIIAVLMAISAVIGALLLEFSSAVLFAAIAIAVGVISAILVFTTRNIPALETKQEAVVFLLLFWIVAPALMALPYLFSGAAMDPVQAYFESVSAFTTTGASTLTPSELPRTLLIYRSLMQFAGGAMVATFAVVILAALNLRGTGVHRSLLFTFKKGELFGRLFAVGQTVAAIYISISLVCFVFLTVSGTSIFDAICLSLSAVATGGLTPQDGPLHGYVGSVGLVALMVTCILGAFNISIIWDMIRARSLKNAKSFLFTTEHRAIWVLIFLLLFVGVSYTGLPHVWTVLVEAVMFVTTAGFDYHVIGLEMVPPVVLISVALIGGSALSTAGGVKLIRILLLFRHLQTDLSRLTHPSRVVPVMFRGQVIPDAAFLSIWMYFFGYTIMFGLGILMLSAMGMNFEWAVASSAASLSNMGPLMNYTLQPESWDAFSRPQLMISSILMLIGRVEVLAVLSIMSPQMWRT